jgi:parallel beta-helix repeat protein
MIIMLVSTAIVGIKPPPVHAWFPVENVPNYREINDIITVDDEGDGDYTSIQEAINHATQDDTINVYSGTYNETIAVDKPLVLEGIDEEYGNGDDSGNPVIDAWNVGTVVEIQANAVTITGFTIQNGKNGSAGISITGYTSNIVDENRIVDNDFGIYLAFSSNNDIGKNEINGNKYGIYLEGSSNNTIYSNKILGNNNYGIYKEDSFTNFICHNMFIGNDINAWDTGINFWNWTYPFGGNYWDDYTGGDKFCGKNQTEPCPEGDGIGDIPYDIPGGNNQDLYPTMWWPYPDDEPPILMIEEPETGFLYILGRQMIPLPFNLTLIIGFINITVTAIDYKSGIDYVKLYINDELKANLTGCGICIWKWDEITFFKFKHTIKAVAYDHVGNNASNEITVWKFF